MADLVPSTPSPNYQQLVFRLLRLVIAGLAAVGIKWGTTLDDPTLMVLANIGVEIGVGVWTLIEGVRASRHTHETAVASAATGEAVQPISASPSPNTAAGVLALCVTALALSACAVQQAPDPKVEKAIAGACVDSGLFKMADGLLTMAAPAASLPVAVVNAGIDKVCANPARFAGDISTIEWVAKNLAAYAKKAAPHALVVRDASTLSSDATSRI